jgi:hypothetical protein
MDLANFTDQQAQATIEAARIGAAAAIRAAWIQATWAAGALAGGVLAHIGAVRQVRLQERCAGSPGPGLSLPSAPGGRGVPRPGRSRLRRR